ncbi:MAG: hypothetical protein LBE35_06295 [Clostridiales bacterium]|jgi:hypothetical protein|nr:hypothetical protein [Clostridiales bacterium]
MKWSKLLTPAILLILTACGARTYEPDCEEIIEITTPGATILPIADEGWRLPINHQTIHWGFWAIDEYGTFWESAPEGWIASFENAADISGNGVIGSDGSMLITLDFTRPELRTLWTTLPKFPQGRPMCCF